MGCERRRERIHQSSLVWSSEMGDEPMSDCDVLWQRVERKSGDAHQDGCVRDAACITQRKHNKMH